MSGLEVAGLRYRVLGPLEVRAADHTLPLSGRRQQTLLAVLLLNVGTTVPFTTLITDLWDDPPPTAHRQVVNAAAAVRRIVADGTGGRLVTTDHGYRLEVPGEELDLVAFGILERAGEAAAAAGAAAEAARLLQDALDLWRGPVLDGLTSKTVEIARQGLAERRLVATERLAALRLDLDEATALVGRLTALVAEHPARESLRVTLMRGLLQAGRTAEALAVFADGRRHLAEEFGADPGPELLALHEQILRSDHRTVATPASFLPSAVSDFTGREAELRRLVALAAATPAGSTAVITVEGMGGVGKTAVAVHAAHRLLPRYPDGEFFVDLGGFADDGPPMSVDAALDVLLRQSGVVREQRPADPLARRDMWRSRMAGRTALIVLDNAVDATQVRPLIPASNGSLVLITSRRQLLSLEGAVALPLDVMDESEAVALFRRVAGPDRLAVEPDGAVHDLVELCGRLPLAIRVAAARISRRPSWTVHHLAGQLRDGHGPHATDRLVRDVIALSFGYLEPFEQRLFCLLSLVPGPDFEVHAVAAMTDVPSSTAAHALEELLESNLLVQHQPGRYRLHNLVHACAREQAEATLPDSDLHTARHRLFDYYLYLVESHSRHFPVVGVIWTPTLRHPPEPQPASASVIEDIRCLDAEYDNLVAAADHAAAQAWHQHAWQLPCLLKPYLFAVGPRSGMLDMARNAVTATRHLGDQDAEVIALTSLAYALREQQQPTEAAAALTRAIDLSREHGDLPALVAVMRQLGSTLFRQGRLAEAAATFSEARDLARALDDRAGEAILALNLAVTNCNLGRYQEAKQQLHDALIQHEHTGDTEGQITALINIGWVCQLSGADEDGLAALESALRVSRANGAIRGQSRALAWLAVSHRRLGHLAAAIDAGRTAQELARKAALVEHQCDALSGLGEAYLAADRLDDADEAFREAERLARQGSLPMLLGRAWEGLAHVAAAQADPDGAGRLWQAALDSYENGAVEADGPRAHLLNPADTSVRCMRCTTHRRPT